MKRLRGCFWIVAMTIFVPLFFSGCVSRRTVEIPQEYRSPPRPQTREKPAVPQSYTAPPPATQSGQGTILTPPPVIREKDLPVDSQPAPPAPKEKKPAGQPQRLASMHLVDQARVALAQNKADQAISLLEQAVQVDVYNGDAFLQLSRAWRIKRSREKALEFAKKAEILFHDQPPKLKEVYLLQADLYKDAGDHKRSQIYLQKAESLR
ncbi:MAG: hypothetical protein GX422_17470 [Deltaproteobacteria bacterium]|nr:hypothetical protein [Deltaproteobacteria bacterium]